MSSNDKIQSLVISTHVRHNGKVFMMIKLLKTLLVVAMFVTPSYAAITLDKDLIGGQGSVIAVTKICVDGAVLVHTNVTTNKKDGKETSTDLVQLFEERNGKSLPVEC